MENENLTGNNWPAPAKLNLFLHIVGRRPDGYHLLQTAFQFVETSDALDFSIRTDTGLSLRRNYSGIAADDDLVLRAARLLQQETGCNFGADITITKRIPVGGGLGGGSSNAATTLVALNTLWTTGLSGEQLTALGLRLGADVPIFIYGHAAWAEGIGEKLTPLEPHESWYLIIYPGCHVPTAEIFQAVDLTRNTPAITIRDFLESGGHNDCEAVVRQRFPAVARALDWLQQYADARMTGSGSSVFAGFDSHERAAAVCELVPPVWQGFVARGLNRSPLLERLGQEGN